MKNLMTFELYIQCVKYSKNYSFYDLFEIKTDTPEFSLNEIALLYDDWEFHLKYTYPNLFSNTQILYEQLNKTIEPAKFKQAMQLIPSCYDYDDFLQAGRICVYFATDLCLKLYRRNNAIDL